MTDNEKLIIFGLRLRQLRQAQGMSQQALASRSGLDRTYISGVERGRRNIRLVNLTILARALGVPLSELFDVED